MNEDPVADAEILGATSAVYLRAAAHLAETSVLMRMARRFVDSDNGMIDPEFERLTGRAAETIEAAAAEYERAVDILSRTSWEKKWQMDEHVDSIRIGVRALNIEAMRHAAWASEEAHAGHDMEADDEASGPFSARDALEDRADGFAVKARQMADYAWQFLARAHRFVLPNPDDAVIPEIEGAWDDDTEEEEEDLWRKGAELLGIPWIPPPIAPDEPGEAR